MPVANRVRSVRSVGAKLTIPMKKTLLFSSLVVGLALTGCNKTTRTDTTATDTTARPADSTAARVDAAARDTSRDIARATERAGDKIEAAGQRAGQAMSNASHDVSAKLTEWKLNAQDLEADIAAKRDIVRTKEVTATPTGAMDKSTLQAAVEGRIKADSELANLKLDVNADRKGEIQLEGKALNAGQIARAMALALDTDGVVKVTSKIKIDNDAVKTR